MLSFTAADARLSMPRGANEICEDILIRVRELASQGKNKLRTGYDYGGDEDVWIHGGYKGSDIWKKCVALLEEAGFSATFVYEERQFVDMCTIIEW